MSNGSGSNNQFLGAGVAFPLGVDGRGKVGMNAYEEHVRQSILLILQTAKGERVMRPDFGCGLRTLVFESAGPATAALVQHEVKDSLVRLEPRIDVLDVQVTADLRQPGELHIDVQYRVRRTDTIFNLVYPFLIERGTL
jgi:hypothetical protein